MFGMGTGVSLTISSPQVGEYVIRTLTTARGGKQIFSAFRKARVRCIVSMSWVLNQGLLYYLCFFAIKLSTY